MVQTAKAVQGRGERMGRRRAGIAAVAWVVVASFLWAPLVAERAGAVGVDNHVVGFEASPSYINLAMVTSVDVQIGTSYGAGLDDYRVTVTAPDGTSWSAWYNFTAVGSLSLPFGDRSSGFNAPVNQAGIYAMDLEHFNGTAFAPAGYAEFTATDVLLVTTEAAAASNEYTDIHNCPVAQEFQRGGEIMGRGYVRYASTGAFVNGTQTPSAKGNVTGTMFGVTKVLTWHNTNHFWRTAWFLTWNQTLGVISFTVTASDGKGNHGTGVQPTSGGTAWHVIPAIMKVVPRILNGTGVPSVLFTSGDTIRIEARVTYEGHNQHNKAFPGPLNGTRGGVVSVALGYGAYNATSGQYQSPLASLSMVLDPATQNWSATYVVKATDPVRSDLQAHVSALDGASPSNTGAAFTTEFAIRAPASTPPPPPAPAPTGLDPIVAVIGAVVALAAGLGVGFAATRRGRAESAPKAKTATKPSKEEEAEEEEWQVEDTDEEGGT